MNNGLDLPCPVCKGSGKVVSPAQTYQACWKCDGTGNDPGVERFFGYIYQNTLTANQILLNQRIVINGDAPFRIKLLTRARSTTTPTPSSDFRIRLFDSQNNYYSSSGEGGANDRVRDVCTFGDGTLPFIVVPHIMIPAGGYIGFDLEDVSGASNLIHIAFLGAKVYPTPTA